MLYNISLLLIKFSISWWDLGVERKHWPSSLSLFCSFKYQEMRGAPEMYIGGLLQRPFSSSLVHFSLHQRSKLLMVTKMQEGFRVVCGTNKITTISMHLKSLSSFSLIGSFRFLAVIPVSFCISPAYWSICSVSFMIFGLSPSLSVSLFLYHNCVLFALFLSVSLSLCLSYSPPPSS